MRNLAERIERLEEVYSPAEIIVIMLTDWGEGEIKGWKGEGYYIARNPGESEEALAARTAAEARAYHNEHPSLLAGHIVLRMDRESVPYVKPEPEPDPKRLPDARPAPKDQPELREIHVIRHRMA
jgi:hypothetical protein